MRQPPLLHHYAMRQGLWLPGLACGLTLVALHFFPSVAQVVPHCALRTFTGIPCPFCGGTRTMLAWSRFDLIGALELNPFAAMLPVLLLIWPLLSRLEPSRRLLYLLGIVVILNWLYLCLSLPPG